MAGTEWKDADRISDQITDMINGEIARGVSPVQIFAGLCLGLMGYMRSAPEDAPQSFSALG
jgi:hypothetical protein